MDNQCEHGNKRIRCRDCFLATQPAPRKPVKRIARTYAAGWDKYYATHDIDHDHSMNG